jgi:hypothetical protein
MKRVASLLVVGALLGTVIVPSPVSRKRKPLQGVFGTIHGKKFSATNVEGASDPCVNGIYEPSASAVTFGAFECRGKRRRQGTAFKKNYKGLVIGCRNFDLAANPLIPPYEIPCIATGYTEARPADSDSEVADPRGSASISRALSCRRDAVRVDSFDGVNVKGAIFGVFDTAQTPDAIPPVSLRRGQFSTPEIQ